MAYTVAVSFDQFIDRISISGDQNSTATARRDRVVSLLENTFTILEAFPTGSIPKRTAVTGSDLDVMVVLHYGKHIEGKTPTQVLGSVRNALAKYRTGVRRNGQAVTLGYESWPDVDIVPVSRTVADNGDVLHYNVPDENRGVWIPSKPKRHTTNIANRVATFGTEFRRIIRMLKWWNQQHSEYLQSFHIEVLALSILNDSFSDYLWDLLRFFDQACELVKAPLRYEGAYVDEYLTPGDRAEALKRLQTATERSRQAWHATYGGRANHKEAIENWRQVFGDRFPAYG
ncbi:MAG TPA: nucleotidyltransferase [Bryobacteraceae bacterium]|jgi:hypothetical protein|nr:nucleotidyltransferase [Bryobacteraceae bacterium]